MGTLSEQFAAAHGTREGVFGSRLFRACLHRRALAFAPVFALCAPDFFAPDRELIARVSRVRSMRELEEELIDFRNDARNQTWWRKHGRVRLSTRRLRRLARPLLGRTPETA